MRVFGGEVELVMVDCGVYVEYTQKPDDTLSAC